MTPILLKNRYQVIRVLGSGGFGETFLAEDTQMPSGCRCVIKQLKPVAHNAQVYQLVQERFQREAAILEELGGNSNQIPRLNAYFTEDGQFYLVQEYIEGQTLTQKLQQHGVLSESSVKDILINILPVLEYVHSKRIVHRDIKPDNIIIRYADGKPILIDFGAVKETMGTVVTASGNSGRSIVIGTPGFMPSEQTAGRPVFSSDLYSLGLTAIYLLTGKIPQELPTDPATGEILWRHYALSVSPSFAAVLDQAIQSHPRDRFSGAREMLQALQTIPIKTTLISAPLLKVSSQPDTVLSSYSPQAAPTSGQLTDLQKIVILGGLISTSVIVGSLLTRSPQVVVSEPKNTPEPSASSQQIIPATPTQSAKILQKESNQPLSLGWIRLGAVNNTVGNASIGEALIPTAQPVTISPSIVPSINNQVTVINGVNLREKQPQKPDYEIPDKKGVVVVGQKIVILNLDYFTDPKSTSPYTVVWAEVGVPN
ncbi:MAG: serine/threonine protein kinase [Tolypothrix brevis GSE-NOS-MK-07-07A]|jgi:serine/threonine-protein kinase|nr:serine/threonine protein kinase [Tolypothrix brevis GSE-NOS-MK-07-07A]